MGSPDENSDATGIDGNQNDTSAPAAGAVYVFSRTGTTWTQQAYVKADDAGENGGFGMSVALSADGNTMAVGSPLAWDESAAGKVYVFSRVGTTWTPQTDLIPSNTRPQAVFGTAVALSADGNTLAVGSPGESSGTTGIDGIKSDTSAPNAGAVYVFSRTGPWWSGEVYVKASNTRANAAFGSAVALSSDGKTLAVGSTGESSGANAVDGDQTDTSAPSAGAVYVFVAQGNAGGPQWSEDTYLKPFNALGGRRVRLARLRAVFRRTDAGGGLPLRGQRLDRHRWRRSKRYLRPEGRRGLRLRRVREPMGPPVDQQAYIKPSNTCSEALFGWGVTLSSGGSTLAVGSYSESSAA